MKLFWKIFIPVFVSAIVLVSFIAYVMASKVISDAENRILEENGFIVSFVAQEIERGYLESRWPFNSLSKLSERDSFLFWWVIRDDGTIHLADEASFMGTNAHAYFPQIANVTGNKNVFMDENQNFGIFVVPLEMGRAQWSFWYGFSTTEISRMRRENVSVYVVVSTFSLLLLGITLYFIVRRFIRPTEDLAAGAEAIGKGDLTHRVRIETKDELGQLANSFNRMADDLQKTTVSKDYVDSIIGNMLDALIVADANGAIRTVNKATCKLLGYEEAELTGKPVETVLAPAEEIPLKGTKLVKLIEEGRLSNYEANYKTKDGKEIPVLFNGSLIKDTDGNITSIVCTARDISERKQMERQLGQTLVELTRSNSELEQFAYIASHDLQEPLRMVSSYLQLLERRYKGKLDSDSDTFINYAVEGANRMRRLINDLLVYSRVGTRGKPFQITECDKLLDQVISNLQVAIEESRAVVTHDALPTAAADPSQLVQLFQNLIGNAIKFRSDDPPRVHISSERVGNEWVFSVRDNGIGIAPEYFERIFRVFQRLHSATEYPGTGIGLALCKKIMERHGGRIWVESEPGKGAQFYFTIPIRGGEQ